MIEIGMNRWRLNLAICKLRHNPWRHQRRWQTPLAKSETSAHDENIATEGHNESPPAPSGSIGLSNEINNLVLSYEADKEFPKDDLPNTTSVRRGEIPHTDSSSSIPSHVLHDFWDKTSPILHKQIPMRIETSSFETQPVRQLVALLDGFLPPSPHYFRLQHPKFHTRSKYQPKRAGSLSLGWHLVHFPSFSPSLRELPDGTDQRFLPGPAESWPFRYWGGGSIEFHTPQPPRLGPEIYDMVEFVDEIHVSGGAEPLRAYVNMVKNFAPARVPFDDLNRPGRRKRVGKMKEPWNKVSNGEGAHITEKYTLMFTRQPLYFESRKIQGLLPDEPAFSHTMTPTTGLLFRWSALTYNGHLIHLDREFSRSVYKLRDLLVQGTLAVIIMLEYLRRILVKFAYKFGTYDIIMRSINYTNIRPIYVDRPMKLCIDQFKNTPPNQFPTQWRLWIQTQGLDGLQEIAFKATVQVEPTYYEQSRDNSKFVQDENEQSLNPDVMDETLEASNGEEGATVMVEPMCSEQSRANSEFVQHENEQSTNSDVTHTPLEARSNEAQGRRIDDNIDSLQDSKFRTSTGHENQTVTDAKKIELPPKRAVRLLSRTRRKPSPSLRRRRILKRSIPTSNSSGHNGL